MDLGVDGEEHSNDVLRITRAGGLTGLVSLGLIVAEGKQLPARLQQQAVSECPSGIMFLLCIAFGA